VTGVTQRAVRTAQRLTAGFFLSYSGSLDWERAVQVLRRKSLGFLSAIDLSCKRSLYFLLHNKIHKLKNWFSHIGFFQGLFYPKILVSLM
jgi:hypothetical protein